MSWQDAIFSGGQVLFIIALIPTILSKDKPPAKTSFMTAAVLITFAITFATLKLWVSFFFTALIGLVWAYIGLQKYLMNKKNSK